jgi:hypothetical protein
VHPLSYAVLPFFFLACAQEIVIVVLRQSEREPDLLQLSRNGVGCPDHVETSKPGLPEAFTSRSTTNRDGYGLTAPRDTGAAAKARI